MAFFDNLGDRINNMGKGIADKAKEVTDTSKLNGQIHDEEKKVSEAYRSIGEKYYKMHQDDPDPEFAEAFEQIHTSEMLLDTYHLEMQKLKGVTTCPNCGAQIDVNAAFCPSCGAKNEVAEELKKKEEANAGRFCPNCGAPLKEDAIFCPECGTRVTPAAEEESTEETTEETSVTEEASEE